MANPWTWLKELFGGTPTCPECHAAVRKAEAHCETCGYDLVARTKAEGGGIRGPA
jgi:predicted amidophosphoribosyltransferase